MKFLIIMSAVLVAVSARMAYQLPDGYLDVLGAEPQQSFDCNGLPFGYYADVSNDCRIFHVCEPLVDESGNTISTSHYSFMCGNQTVFSQDSLTCAHEVEAYPCLESEALYASSNADFGKIPENK